MLRCYQSGRHPYSCDFAGVSIPREPANWQLSLRACADLELLSPDTFESRRAIVGRISCASTGWQTRSPCLTCGVDLRADVAPGLRSAVFLDATVTAQKQTRFGALYMIDFDLRTRQGGALVRSGRIVRTGEDSPRLTT